LVASKAMIWRNGAGWPGETPAGAALRKTLGEAIDGPQVMT
jgi:hypothetical protein